MLPFPSEPGGERPKGNWSISSGYVSGSWTALLFIVHGQVDMHVCTYFSRKAYLSAKEVSLWLVGCTSTLVPHYFTVSYDCWELLSGEYFLNIKLRHWLSLSIDVDRDKSSSVGLTGIRSAIAVLHDIYSSIATMTVDSEHGDLLLSMLLLIWKLRSWTMDGMQNAY